MKALDFAAKSSTITEVERNIIIHAKRTALISRGETWSKKGGGHFDITMGAFDGAESCELVTAFLLTQLKSKIMEALGCTGMMVWRC